MQPAFHANPDNSHCLQATLKMALEAVHPERTWTYSQLNQLCHKRVGEGTWTHGAYLAMGTLGVEAIAYDTFDYQAFARDPVRALMRAYPGPVATEMMVHYDLQHAAAMARTLLQNEPVRRHGERAEVADVLRLLEDGYLVIANVNLATLDGRGGTTGHSVLIFDADAHSLIGHDPGHHGRGIASRRMPIDLFERAWSFMGADNRELLAIRTQDAVR